MLSQRRHGAFGGHNNSVYVTTSQVAWIGAATSAEGMPEEQRVRRGRAAQRAAQLFPGGGQYPSGSPTGRPQQESAAAAWEGGQLAADPGSGRRRMSLRWR